MTAKRILEKDRQVIQAFKEIFMVLDTLKETEFAMRAIRNNIYVHSFTVNLEQFIHIFYTEIVLREIISDLEKQVNAIEAYVGELDGIDQKVVYRRDVEHKSLGMIANELGYSYGYIKNISSKNPRCKNDFLMTDKSKKPC